MTFDVRSGDQGMFQSPGGHEFGVQGWVWNEPRPTSITFFWDNTVMVLDQYGRCVRGAVSSEGQVIHFADSPPTDARDATAMASAVTVVPRPQFATHIQSIEALRSEGYDWMWWEVAYRGKDMVNRLANKLTYEAACLRQHKLATEGNTHVVVRRSITCVGWPQVPYDWLKKLPQLPSWPWTMEPFTGQQDGLPRIRDKKLWTDAKRAYKEARDGEQAEEARERQEV